MFLLCKTLFIVSTSLGITKKSVVIDISVLIELKSFFHIMSTNSVYEEKNCDFL